MKFSRYKRIRFPNASETVSQLLLLFLLTRQTVSYLADGDGEIRTLDPLLARQVLSQLSYTPIHTFLVCGWA